jgi:hypothetical protein
MPDDKPKTTKPTRKKTTTKRKSVRAPVTKPIKAPPVQKQTHFTTAMWNRRTIYRCVHCPFTSFTERDAWVHFAQKHQPPRPTGTGLVGPDGKPLNPEPEEG